MLIGLLTLSAGFACISAGESPDPPSEDTETTDTETDDSGEKDDTGDSSPPLPETDCADGLDNDSDGRIDCEDEDCPLDCTESDCADGVDNDGDALIDCEDAECWTQCTEQLCGDELDNDEDGFTDCLDEDCWGEAVCADHLFLSVNSGAGRFSNCSRSGGSGSVGDIGVSVTSPEGSALFIRSSSTVACDWSADRLGLSRNRGAFSISSSMTVAGLVSTGACDGQLNSSHLKAKNQSSSTGSPDFHINFGNSYFIGVNRKPFISGPAESTFKSGSCVGTFFSVEPTNPWKRDL